MSTGSVRHFVEVETCERIVKTGETKEVILIVYPTYTSEATDFMKKGNKYYAVLDHKTGMWTEAEKAPFRIIDEDVENYISTNFQKDGYGVYRTQNGLRVVASLVRNWQSGRLKDYNQWVMNLPPNFNFVPLDSDLTFKSDEVTPDMYRSKRLPYDISEGSTEAYDRLMDTLYSPENREKLEWAIGSVLTGDSKIIDKMIVIYSYPGFGKSTVLDIIKALFDGYHAKFEAEDLVTKSNQFATAAFKDNPLVAIQDDGKMSKIESPVINEIVSHQLVTINEKNKPQYTIRSNAMLFIATNDLVDLHDTKAGITRRLIDVYPTKQKLPVDEYRQVVKQIKFELPAIAYHCREVYVSLGREYFEGYIPIDMIAKTNYLRNFLFDNLDELISQPYCLRNTLYNQYKQYCEDSGLGYPPKRIIFGEQLKEYFDEYYDIKWIDDKTVRHAYAGIRVGKITGIRDPVLPDREITSWIELKEQPSILDQLYSDCPAQYANERGTPRNKWEKVTTKLHDIDPKQLHWFILPKEVIKVDFDKRGPDGEKSLKENIKAASAFPPTYCEVSKSGNGLHLYYIWAGDPDELSRLVEEHVEVKIGTDPHRRILTLCNNHPLTKLETGLPLKEARKVVNLDIVETEKGLRTTIKKCIAKDVHGDTTSNVDFIYDILEKAYNSGISYDVSDLRVPVFMFAAGATNQAEKCKALVMKMHFMSEDKQPVPVANNPEEGGPIIIFDCEVFPNLFIICWSYEDDNAPVVKMINPSAEDVSSLFGLDLPEESRPRLVGFNNRGYDNHICYARIMGASLNELYLRSKAIVGNDRVSANNAKYREAYNLSYTDIYDYASTKQSLKKWEIQLNMQHVELPFDWDQPVDEENWETVANYCCNDVIATKAVWKATAGDFAVRKVAADLSGLTVNDTNRQHITRILLGNDKQADHVYTNLATGVAVDIDGMPVPLNPDIINSFPGYEFVKGEDGKWHNMYLGTDLGRGGYVYAEEGIYYNVALLDVGNMHGASILNLNKFGRHTINYKAIRDARMAIKRRDYETASKLLGGKFAKYLTSDEMAENLQQMLKLMLNSTYGIAEATFDNPLKDPRDRENTIALRGALFMRKLQAEVARRGFDVVHIKTDSIKIPNATQEIIDFCIDFGRLYGYEFEHEATYERFCLVNDAVYIAKYDSQGVRNKGNKHAGEWTATGAQFAHPYVFKTLFTHDSIIFNDVCELKSSRVGAIYLVNEEGEEPVYTFVGRNGQFCPMISGCGAGSLVYKKDNKFNAVTGTKGYLWMESETVKEKHLEGYIDYGYYRALVDEAVATINQYGPFDVFVADGDEYEMEFGPLPFN